MNKTERLADGAFVPYPFDFEEHIRLCTREASGECHERYPELSDGEYRKVVAKLRPPEDDLPETIFRLEHPFKEDLDVFILSFEGDSNLQELVVLNKDGIITRQLVGYSMPENKTYQSFVIDHDMVATIHEVDYGDGTRKVIGAYRITPEGKILVEEGTGLAAPTASPASAGAPRGATIEGRFVARGCENGRFSIVVEDAGHRRTFKIYDKNGVILSGEPEVSRDPESDAMRVLMGDMGGTYADGILTVQNYGNSMSEFEHFPQCEDKYLEFTK